MCLPGREIRPDSDHFPPFVPVRSNLWDDDGQENWARQGSPFPDLRVLSVSATASCEPHEKKYITILRHYKPEFVRGGRREPRVGGRKRRADRGGVTRARTRVCRRPRGRPSWGTPLRSPPVGSLFDDRFERPVTGHSSVRLPTATGKTATGKVRASRHRPLQCTPGVRMAVCGAAGDFELSDEDQTEFGFGVRTGGGARGDRTGVRSDRTDGTRVSSPALLWTTSTPVCAGQFPDPTIEVLGRVVRGRRPVRGGTRPSRRCWSSRTGQDRSMRTEPSPAIVPVQSGGTSAVLPVPSRIAGPGTVSPSVSAGRQKTPDSTWPRSSK